MLQNAVGVVFVVCPPPPGSALSTYPPPGRVLLLPLFPCLLAPSPAWLLPYPSIITVPIVFNTGGPLDEAQEARVKEMNRRLLSQQDLPEFEPVPLTLAMLVAEGMRLVQEQQMVNNSKLGEEYMVRRVGGTLRWTGVGGGGVTIEGYYMPFEEGAVCVWWWLGKGEAADGRQHKPGVGVHGEKCLWGGIGSISTCRQRDVCSSLLAHKFCLTVPSVPL